MFQLYLSGGCTCGHSAGGSFEELPYTSMKQLTHNQFLTTKTGDPMGECKNLTLHQVTYFEKAANMEIVSLVNSFIIKQNTKIW